MLFYRASNLLEISGTGLTSLDLNSLEKIGFGDVLIVRNKDLCLADSVNWTALQIDSGSKILVADNRDRRACGEYFHTIFLSWLNNFHLVINGHILLYHCVLCCSLLSKWIL